MTSSPDTGAGTPGDLPVRVVVGRNGAYWRDYGDHYSMCPVSTDNDPVEVAAVYVRSRITEAEEWARDAARSRPAAAGLDVERLAEALVAVTRENLYPGDKGGARWRQRTAERLAADYARLSVADGPGPE